MKRAIITIAFLAICGCTSETEEKKAVEIPLYRKLESKADSLVIKASNAGNLAVKYNCDKYAYLTYKEALAEAKDQADNALKSKYVNAILTRVVNMRQVGGDFNGTRQEIEVLLRECKAFIDEGSIDSESVMRYEKLSEK